MSETLAFVLSGGGSRGALQLGALYALQEQGLQPDMLVGTSIGSINAAFLAIHGFSRESLDQMHSIWRRASEMELLPSNYIWLAMRAVLGRSSNDASARIRDFLIELGLSPDLRFSELLHPRLFIVSADLNTGQPVIHGDQPGEKVLEGVLLSSALPPWVMPVRRQGRYLMDGGVVSNLPVEPALRMGAGRIIALDLMDKRDAIGSSLDVTGFMERLAFAVEKRQGDLELELAAARGVPIVYIALTGDSPIPQWDFRHTDELIQWGYELTVRLLDEQPIPEEFFS